MGAIARFANHAIASKITAAISRTSSGEAIALRRSLLSHSAITVRCIAKPRQPHTPTTPSAFGPIGAKKCQRSAPTTAAAQPSQNVESASSQSAGRRPRLAITLHPIPKSKAISASQEAAVSTVPSNKLVCRPPDEMPVSMARRLWDSTSES